MNFMNFGVPVLVVITIAVRRVPAAGGAVNATVNGLRVTADAALVIVFALAEIFGLARRRTPGLPEDACRAARPAGRAGCSA